MRKFEEYLNLKNKIMISYMENIMTIKTGNNRLTRGGDITKNFEIYSLNIIKYYIN